MHKAHKIEVVAHTYLKMYNKAIYTELETIGNLEDYYAYAFKVDGKFYSNNKDKELKELWDKTKMWEKLKQ